MQSFVIFLGMILYCECLMNNTDDCANIKTHIGSVRKRRHLTFPENTNMVVSNKTTKQIKVNVRYKK